MRFYRGWILSIPMVLLMGGASVVYGDTALHGFCWGVTPVCTDNGTNTPTPLASTIDFGFWTGGGASGDYVVDVLVPNSQDSNPSSQSFAITGTETGTATLFSTTAWTSSTLGSYLGNGGSPSNPIGAFLPSTQVVDPGATGFFVYQADLGASKLGSAAGTGPLETLSIGTGFARGAYLVGFLNVGASAPDWHATANSGAIFVTPEPSYGIFLGAGLVLIGFARRAASKLRA